jgi:hypothetical protein
MLLYDYIGLKGIVGEYDKPTANGRDLKEKGDAKQDQHHHVYRVLARFWLGINTTIGSYISYTLQKIHLRVISIFWVVC